MNFIKVDFFQIDFLYIVDLQVNMFLSFFAHTRLQIFDRKNNNEKDFKLSGYHKCENKRTGQRTN
jgi:hypothetical protein